MSAPVDGRKLMFGTSCRCERVKNFPIVLDSFVNVKFMDVTIAVDSQVKDIALFKKSLLQDYGMTV